jgi:hypothetical protein
MHRCVCTLSQTAWCVSDTQDTWHGAYLAGWPFGCSIMALSLRLFNSLLARIVCTRRGVMLQHSVNSPPAAVVAAADHCAGPAPWPSCRRSHAAVVLGDGLWVHGGLGSRGQHLDDLWRLDLHSWQWQHLAGQVGSLQSSFENVVIQQQIYHGAAQHNRVPLGDRCYVYSAYAHVRQ